MSKLHACLAVAVCALAACGGDDNNNTGTDAGMPDSSADAKVFMDAPPPTFDFSCMGNAAPTTATAEITLSGTVTRVSLNGITPQFTALSGASVRACVTGTTCANQDELDMATSAGANGAFSLGPMDTSSMPWTRTSR